MMGGFFAGVGPSVALLGVLALAAVLRLTCA